MRRITLIAALFTMLLWGPAPTHAAEEFDLESLLACVQSGDEISASSAREELDSELYRLLVEGDPAELEGLVSRMIGEIETAEDPVVVVLADALGVMPGYWRADDHEWAKNLLYEKMDTAESNLELWDALDFARMNADGLYFDAIDDYSDDRVDDIEGTAQKFRGVFENFSMSGWAASAHAYLARYFTRTFFVQEDHPRQVSTWRTTFMPTSSSA